MYIKRFKDGGNIRKFTTGGSTEADARRIQAHQNSVNITTHVNPQIPFNSEEIQALQKEYQINLANLQKYKDSKSTMFGVPAKVQLNWMEQQMWNDDWAKTTQERNQQIQAMLQRGCKEGSACTYTATGFYGPDVQTASSQEFVNTHKERGFQEVDKKDAMPGDIVVSFKPEENGWRPHHTLMFNRFDENGTPRYNGSNGRELRKDARYPVPFDSLAVYRFVGKP